MHFVRFFFYLSSLLESSGGLSKFYFGMAYVIKQFRNEQINSMEESVMIVIIFRLTKKKKKEKKHVVERGL